jgi:hypothetical protein
MRLKTFILLSAWLINSCASNISYKDAAEIRKAIYWEQPANAIELFESDTTRKLESMLTYDQVSPLYEYRSEADSTSEIVYKRKLLLEKVPDQIQSLMTQGGNEIIFFNGQITDQPEFARNKGKIPRGWPKEYTWDKVPLGQSEGFNSVLIGIKGDYYIIDEQTLHEYGHAYDAIMGKTIFGGPISQTSLLSSIKGEYEYQLKDYLKHNEEFVAFIFDNYYKSEESKQELKKNMPKAYELLKAIEIAVATNNYSTKK